MSNIAISCHSSSELIEQYQRELNEFKEELRIEYKTFEKFLDIIIADFKEKKKSMEIMIISVRY